MSILELKLASWPHHHHIEAKGPAKVLHCPTVQNVYRTMHNADVQCIEIQCKKCSAMHSCKQLHHRR